MAIRDDSDTTRAATAAPGRNGRVALICAGVVVGMVGAAYAAVPLYNLFCRATGYGGTTQQAEVGADVVLDRVMKIRFNTDTGRDMPWEFQPVKRKMKLHVGETGMAFFRAHNPTNETIMGTAAYNVTPQKAGIYFDKLACFCFTEQVLAPGETVDMPVQFFVDPAIADDRNLDDVTTITLSYTFFRKKFDADDKVAAVGNLDDPSARVRN